MSWFSKLFRKESKPPVELISDLYMYSEPYAYWKRGWTVIPLEEGDVIGRDIDTGEEWVRRYMPTLKKDMPRFRTYRKPAQSGKENE
jgi:hypothetical protein